MKMDEIEFGVPRLDTFSDRIPLSLLHYVKACPLKKIVLGGADANRY